LSGFKDYNLPKSHRMTDSEDGNFEFVMQTSNSSFSNETRTKIRRKAMKAVTARRKLATNPASRVEPRYQIWQDPSSLHPSPPITFSGLELLVKDRGLDPMDLSALTSIYMGTMYVKLLLNVTIS
jgi:hypothetical protein